MRRRPPVHVPARPRASRRDRRLPLQPPAVIPQWAPRTDDDAAERLRKRTRQLAIANQLGARLAAMTDVRRDPRGRRRRAARGVRLLPLRRHPDPRGRRRRERRRPRRGVRPARRRRAGASPCDHGLIGRCLRDAPAGLRRRRVRASPTTTPTPETASVRSELVVPLWVDGELWGAINVEARRAGRVRRGRRAAAADGRRPGRRRDALRRPLRAARARLPRAPRRRSPPRSRPRTTTPPTTRARSPSRPRRSAGALGMSEHAAARPAARRRLPRHRQDRGARGDPQQARPAHARGARGDGAPHDRRRADPRAGRVPRRRLPARAPRARALGRPRLSRTASPASEIPLGSRIILACDALHAMTSDRPYRRALPRDVAHAELRRNAGTQFDPRGRRRAARRGRRGAAPAPSSER